MKPLGNLVEGCIFSPKNAKKKGKKRDWGERGGRRLQPQTPGKEILDGIRGGEEAPLKKNSS